MQPTPVTGRPAGGERRPSRLQFNPSLNQREREPFKETRRKPLRYVTSAKSGVKVETYKI